MMATLEYVVLLVLGVAMLAGAIGDWERLRKDWRSQLLLRYLGKTGTRLLQGAAGALLAATGFTSPWPILVRRSSGCGLTAYTFVPLKL